VIAFIKKQRERSEALQSMVENHWGRKGSRDEGEDEITTVLEPEQRYRGQQ